MKEKYHVHYRLNGDEDERDIYASLCPPNLNEDEVYDFLVRQLKSLISYDSSKHNLTNIHYTKIN